MVQQLEEFGACHDYRLSAAHPGRTQGGNLFITWTSFIVRPSQISRGDQEFISLCIDDCGIDFQTVANDPCILKEACHLIFTIFRDLLDIKIIVSFSKIISFFSGW